MAFNEDMSAFFDTSNGFAVAGLYAGSTTINGILDSEYYEGGSSDYPGVSSVRTIFIYDANDLSAVTPGSLFLADGVNYYVKDAEFDRGLGKLILEAT